MQAIERTFVAGAQVPLRHAHALSGQDSLLLMPAWDDELLISKIVTVMPRAAHTVQASVLVLDRHSGAPLALLDGEALTLRRTAATSALAARLLALPDAQTVLMVGTGRLAAWMLRAHVALRPGLRQVLIWGRNPLAAQQLADELTREFALQFAQGTLPSQPTVHSVAALPQAVAQAQIVCCATTSTVPLVLGEWLTPGTHLDLVGGFRPDMREVDDAAVQRAFVVVDTYAGALAEAGDLTQPLASGAIARTHVRAELAELLRAAQTAQTAPTARPDAQAITLFKSVGTALEDLAAARCVLQQPLAS